MLVPNYEQRVANTPVALLCDECRHEDICRYADSMRAVEVEKAKLIKGMPFKIDISCTYMEASNEGAA